MKKIGTITYGVKNCKTMFDHLLYGTFTIPGTFDFDNMPVKGVITAIHDPYNSSGVILELEKDNGAFYWLVVSYQTMLELEAQCLRVDGN